MSEKSGMNKILNWKLGQIKQLSHKLKEVVDSYVSKITGSAQMWIDRSEDYNQQSFLDVTMQVDQTMFMLTEKVSEIESKLACQLLDADTLETTLKSVTHLSSQINVGSQAIDQPVSSLQERIHSLESVVGSVQAGLDHCRKQIDTVEGIKTNLENLASQVEVILNDKSVQQIQREIEYYMSKEVVRIQNYDDRLLKIENTLSTTDNQVKDLSVLSKFITDEHRTLCDSSSKFDHRLSDLKKKSEITNDRVMIKLTEMEADIKQMKLQIDGVIEDSSNFREIQENSTTMETNITENNMQSLGARLHLIEKHKKARPKIENKEVEEADNVLASGIKEIQPKRTFTGFIASGETVTSSGYRYFMNIHALRADTLFDETTKMVTAPVDGEYLVIFMHRHVAHSKGTTFVIFHLDKTARQTSYLCTTSTDGHCSYKIGRTQITMRAGDKLFFSPTKENRVEIPVFCCVLTG